MAVIVKFMQFDNSRAVKRFPYPGSSAWALRNEREAQEFMASYEDAEPRIIEDAESIMACDYKAMDDYVIGKTSAPPPLIPFDQAAHCVVPEAIQARCHCGDSECGAWGMTTWWENPYQVVIQQPVHVPEDNEWDRYVVWVEKHGERRKAFIRGWFDTGIDIAFWDDPDDRDWFMTEQFSVAGHEVFVKE